MTPLYLYAIVADRPRRALGKGIARRSLSAMRAGKAWVVVERAAAPAPTPKALLAHDRVVRRIFRATPAVLPLRFASTAANRDALVELLTPFSRSLPQAFDRVRGAVQFTLRAIGTPAPAPPVARRTGPGTRWLTKRLAKTRVPELAALTEASRPFVREVRVERHDRTPFASSPVHFATQYHLVSTADVAAWRAAVERSLPLLESVIVTVTGPWPPYAFAELT